MYRDAIVELDDNRAVSPSDDARVTRIGRALRHTSADELPQLWNVLRGEMSLVGPRPDLLEALTMYDERERKRLAVRPGLTGLAQVCGRNLLDAHQKWRLDVEYAERATVAGDLRILAKTVVMVLFREGIYCDEVKR
jgi:undecaprenyl phosphate N,N'-diacetylbacillosamine 1-phosphate transferase